MSAFSVTVMSLIYGMSFWQLPVNRCHISVPTIFVKIIPENVFYGISVCRKKAHSVLPVIVMQL